MNKFILATGGILCALAVMLGAFAAHGLKLHISPSMITVFQTGVDYQFFHGLALILFGILSHLGYRLKWASIFAMLGVVFFSGSLYLLATTGSKIFGPITPIGGVCFIVSWLIFTIRVVKHQSVQTK